MKRAMTMVLFGALALASCTTTDIAASGNALAGTEWVLIQHGDPAKGELSEAPVNGNTMTLGGSGDATFKLDCNRGTAAWQSNGTAATGTLSFGPVAATRAMCNDNGLGEALARDLSSASGYDVYDGRMTMKIANSPTQYVWDTID